MSDFNLTLFEACEYLNKSKKSISRYIRRGLLHPQEIKSQQGTLEYRFSKADLEAFKLQEAQGKTRQDRQDETSQSGQTEPTEINTNKTKEIKEETGQDQTSQDRTEQTGQDTEIITLLKETTGLLKGQLVKKDEQIKDLGGKIDGLIERSRETNLLMGQMQSKVLMLERPKETIINGDTEQTGQDTPDKTGQDKPIKPLKEKKKQVKSKKKQLEKLEKDKQSSLNKPTKTKKEKKKGFWSDIFK